MYAATKEIRIDNDEQYGKFVEFLRENKYNHQEKSGGNSVIISVYDNMTKLSAFAKDNGIEAVWADKPEKVSAE